MYGCLGAVFRRSRVRVMCVCVCVYIYIYIYVLIYAENSMLFGNTV